MATQRNIESITMKAAGDLSAKQFRIVSISASDTVNGAVATGALLGVLQNKPSAAGQAAEVAVYGVAKIQMVAASGSAGARIGSDANSLGAVVTADDANYVGIALEDWASANALVPCLLTPGQQVGA
jgi:hypothetical protein